MLHNIIFDGKLNYSSHIKGIHKSAAKLRGIKQNGSFKALRFSSLENAPGGGVASNQCGTISVDWSSYTITGHRKVHRKSTVPQEVHLGEGGEVHAEEGKKGGVGALQTLEGSATTAGSSRPSEKAVITTRFGTLKIRYRSWTGGEGDYEAM
jgi:hypothetical protein